MSASSYKTSFPMKTTIFLLLTVVVQLAEVANSAPTTADISRLTNIETAEVMYSNWEDPYTIKGHFNTVNIENTDVKDFHLEDPRVPVAEQQLTSEKLMSQGKETESRNLTTDSGEITRTEMPKVTTTGQENEHLFGNEENMQHLNDLDDAIDAQDKDLVEFRELGAKKNRMVREVGGLDIPEVTTVGHGNEPDVVDEEEELNKELQKIYKQERELELSQLQAEFDGLLRNSSAVTSQTSVNPES